MIECSNNRMFGSEITDPKVKPYANISVFSRIESNSVRRGPKGPRLSFFHRPLLVLGQSIPLARF